MDFDHTVTKQHENGTPTPCSILTQWEKLPESSANAIEAARKNSRLSVFNFTTPLEQKIQTFNEMYRTILKELRGLELDRKEIEKMFRNCGSTFRDGAKELFLKLQNSNIPVLVCSAGFSDIIEEQLNQEDIHCDNINIIANHLKFNGTMLDGLENNENFIHTFNKHEHVSQYSKSETLKNRKNIILMGDIIADATITSGFENQETVLKIGFFFNQTEDDMNSYKETFDIVLNDDQTMNVILSIINLL